MHSVKVPLALVRSAIRVPENAMAMHPRAHETSRVLLPAILRGKDPLAVPFGSLPLAGIFRTALHLDLGAVDEADV
eukprot:CAMPEP_0117472846 /NCGR_PEP_ID=MMETSP0784-20121206/8461_1 /TAXON_ID=39447 /ORGANISM="" /LENGTH=75 /DNA_ID=CAMNT_0005267017 /DNA_START=624 /DNA_END=851 /DNA_ORIENTATION=-